MTNHYFVLRNLEPAYGFAFGRVDSRATSSRIKWAVIERKTETMKRTIAGILLLIGMGAGTMFADDAWRDRRDIRRDDARIAHDRRELRSDLYRGNYGAARHERRELRHEYRDRRDLYWDRR
jgi:hypothetical protein